jgi:hypothetical protein
MYRNKKGQFVSELDALEEIRELLHSKKIPVKCLNDFDWNYKRLVKVKTDSFQKWVMAICAGLFFGVIIGLIAVWITQPEPLIGQGPLLPRQERILMYNSVTPPIKHDFYIGKTGFVDRCNILSVAAEKLKN